jgi:hypothetical protein
LATERQIEANRRNATNATGPTTSEGKKKVAQNSTKHGLTAKNSILLQEESWNDYQTLQGLVRNDLRPIGVLEQELVGRIVDIMWRLRRAGLIETGVLTYAYHNRACTQATMKLQAQGHGVMLASQGTAIERAESELAEASSKRDREVSMLGQAFIEDAEDRNALMKLARYETALWNHLSRARQELQILQEKRLRVEESK